ncbi:hypothetical protein, variant [Aphanomyces invadans]|uniref:Peptidase M20 dimerisation domain-containing protein n=1 Tax=Aphanomyces invadans TaxID=157072 RepID=A0A024TEG9_9STRA|nr:hypothetical protein, variant [Aphanomyces invadans]ETV91981.1 hypothetical protein, variant [Aphanomyces invadans]|eukprot:XP_008879405.1 hypothetical protein, variant [Aphanomyces invadans]
MTATMDIAAFFGGLRATRHELHAHPEVSFQEFKTQERLEAYLVNESRIPKDNITRVATTGLVVDIHGPTDGDKTTSLTCIAFRADMDGLPMTEANPRLPYKSTAVQCAHMCGHDGHMATLLGFATLVQSHRHLLPPHTTVRLLFQPAEEGHFGAPAMIQDGCLDGVDEIYGYHNIPYPVGEIRVKAGPMMSHSARFSIKIRGPGGHGSAPHQTQDPIVAAGHIIVAMQSILSRNVAAHDSGVLSITQVHGGEADNVIPSVVTLSGTLRDFSPAVSALMQKRMAEIVEHTSKAYNVEGAISFKDGYPVVVNASAQADIVTKVAQKVVGSAKVTADGLPLCASEDFAYYLQTIPGCFYFVGTNDTAQSQNRSVHSDTYDFNDDILPVAVRMFVEVLQHRFNCTLFSDHELQAWTQ